MALEQQQCQAGRTAGPTYPAAVCSHGPAHRACDLVGTGSAPGAGRRGRRREGARGQLLRAPGERPARAQPAGEGSRAQGRGQQEKRGEAPVLGVPCVPDSLVVTHLECPHPPLPSYTRPATSVQIHLLQETCPDSPVRSNTGTHAHARTRKLSPLSAGTAPASSEGARARAVLPRPAQASATIPTMNSPSALHQRLVTKPRSFLLAPSPGMPLPVQPRAASRVLSRALTVDLRYPGACFSATQV